MESKGLLHPISPLEGEMPVRAEGGAYGTPSILEYPW
ncbi:hypothetical protein J2X76_000704 [Neorhizobium sp. 2083]|nr:hypothetical protein [Neorhizobium sp. 2083]